MSGEPERANKVERFEDLIAWQKARELTRMVYQLTKGGVLARDARLTGQLEGAAVSVMSNIAEGFERGSKREFCHFLYIAKASAGEVRSLLYVANDLEYIDEATYQTLMEQAAKLSRQVVAFIKYLDSDIQRTSGRRLATHDLEPLTYDS